MLWLDTNCTWEENITLCWERKEYIIPTQSISPISQMVKLSAQEVIPGFRWPPGSSSASDTSPKTLLRALGLFALFLNVPCSSSSTSFLFLPDIYPLTSMGQGHLLAKSKILTPAQLLQICPLPFRAGRTAEMPSLLACFHQHLHR